MTEPFTAPPGTTARLLVSGPLRWLVLGLVMLAVAVAVYGYARFDDLGRELALAQRDARALAEHKLRLDAALSATRKQIDELKSLQAANDAEVKKSREDAKAASVQSMQFQDRARGFEAELAKLKGETGAERSAWEAVQRDAAQLMSAKSDAEARAAAAASERTALSERAAELARQLATANSQLDAARRDLAKAREAQSAFSPAPTPAAPPLPSAPPAPQPAGPQR